MRGVCAEGQAEVVGLGANVMRRGGTSAARFMCLTIFVVDLRRRARREAEYDTRMLPERYHARPAELILTLPRHRDASTRADLLNLQTLATRYRGAAELTPNSTRPKCPKHAPCQM